jgi:ABC-2 type transport system permease protein
MLALATTLMCLTALYIRRRRDLGASLFEERMGPERGPRPRRSLMGLAWRLQRGTLAGWSIAGAVIGGLAGALAPVVTDVVAGNPTMQDLFERLSPGTVSGAGIVDLFLTALLGITSLLAAAAGVQAVLRLRAEETEGRAELLLAVPVTAGRWVAANLAMAGVSVIAVTFAAGCAATVGLALSGSLGSRGVSAVGAGLAYAPAAAIFPAVTALVFAVLPRLSVGAAWSLLIAGLVLGQFGDLLGLPVWMQDLSPFRHSSAMPVEEFQPTSAALLTLLAIVFAGAAVVLIRRRDLTA